MTDTLTKEQRSRTMSRIRSKWTSQEKKMHNYLKAKKIKHKMHPKIRGSPDSLIYETNTAVFLHGCFWHKCPKCYNEPKSHKDYWLPKIERTVKRDRENEKILKEQGFKVVKIWEHEIKKDAKSCISRLVKKL
ncbi:MAG: very short patch repair endonuclease [Nanoarchaeota archaeon]|nr:very short patch repair endonuclease [Nanoarchaeota archaeon]MBU4300667.1 very short patch repair endonuclease [Nanoarchaeota archaeon]MBU4451820.1 very short patch repair endonuclease [Nanoarchaeota archaeon]MCG2723452.1 very short patch repair endonuclease [archaeon]